MWAAESGFLNISDRLCCSKVPLLSTNLNVQKKPGSVFKRTLRSSDIELGGGGDWRRGSDFLNNLRPSAVCLKDPTRVAISTWSKQAYCTLRTKDNKWFYFFLSAGVEKKSSIE